ncbi:hypothetical protein ETAE_2659 [Edwardsiella piscicida]|uniref:Uncharacterized protein n=1 Tax=Edwardsiella piscicida TaxID=1263550 RepID=A0AAU8PB43_EDWPI|nr:hypothetical protein ETAE_2659 [Edwardsiella tarda EIB202]
MPPPSFFVVNPLRRRRAGDARTSRAPVGNGVSRFTPFYDEIARDFIVPLFIELKYSLLK